jgi:hypothetical protein
MAAIILLGSIYQIDGVASGRLVGGIAALPIIVIVERLVFERIQWKLWLSIAVGVIPASLAMFLVDTLIVSNLGKSWFGFLISTALLTLGYWPTLLLTGYTTRSEMISAFASAAASDQDAEPVVAMR